MQKFFSLVSLVLFAYGVFRRFRRLFLIGGGCAVLRLCWPETASKMSRRSQGREPCSTHIGGGRSRDRETLEPRWWSSLGESGPPVCVRRRALLESAVVWAENTVVRQRRATANCGNGEATTSVSYGPSHFFKKRDGPRTVASVDPYGTG